MYDRCVAGDRLRTVMSSIMRRRRGLIFAIGGSRLKDWASTTAILSDRRPSPNRLLQSRDSGFVQSPECPQVLGHAHISRKDLLSMSYEKRRAISGGHSAFFDF